MGSTPAILNPVGFTEDDYAQAANNGQRLGTVTDVWESIHKIVNGTCTISGIVQPWECTEATRNVKVGQNGFFEKRGNKWFLVSIKQPPAKPVSNAPIPSIPNAPSAGGSIPGSSFGDNTISTGAPSTYDQAYINVMRLRINAFGGRFDDIYPVINSLISTVNAMGGRINTVRDQAVAVGTATNGVVDALKEERIAR